MQILLSETRRLVVYPTGDAPSGLAVSLALVKEQLRLPSDLTDEDNILTNYINAAERAIESSSSLVIRQRTYSATFSHLPLTHILHSIQYSALHFSRSPSPQKPTITYGNNSTVSADDITLYQNEGKSFFTVKSPEVINAANWQYSRQCSLSVTLGPPTIDPRAVTAILNIVGHCYRNREDPNPDLVRQFASTLLMGLY